MAKNNCQLSHDGKEAMLRIPNSPSSFTCYNRMKNVFDLMGDSQQMKFTWILQAWKNSGNSTSKQCRMLKSAILDVELLRVFVFVKIRELKAVNCKYFRSYDNVDFYFILFFEV